MKITLKKVDENIDLICPSCKKVLKETLQKNVKLGTWSNRPIFACSECKVILPFAVI